MSKTDFIQAVQARCARVACSASATRGSAKDTVEVGRNYLTKLSLQQFSVGREKDFFRKLDLTTKRLADKLPTKKGTMRSSNWGLARKLLNIFLRDALYDKYLSKYYKLARIEYFLEIPIDSITAKALRRKARESDYGRLSGSWNGIRKMTKDEHSLYQNYANYYANHQANSKMARVHLDAYWWGLR